MMIGTDAQKDFLRQAFDNAFTLTALASSSLATMDARAMEVYGWIFGPEESEADQVVKELVKLSFEGMGGMSDEKSSASDLSRADVHVHCTHKRLELSHQGIKPRWYDPELEEHLRFRDIFDCNIAMAYTIVPSAALKPSLIQICPWFLEYAMNKDPKFQNQIKAGIMAKLAGKLDEWVTGKVYTPIDLVQLFDKVIVHEMSHTRNGGRTDDVGGFGGYGWKNVRALSTQRTDVAAGKKGPEKNADSIALFASAVQLLGVGVTINEDGTFVRPGDRRRALGIDPLKLKGRLLI
ncbi:hypothetical protein EJ04DRAFT_172959 [Polyplosphaeria fusca]|uniref:Uncharacterized protein n=1 Tax=Polyplosphaeria fusca TaxID=682080 RepID=A0A9P4R4D0_9PLEO|nr:hypothetical protein EJ04DRAFT_172959 [Polyplosphaeria fusca]